MTKSAVCESCREIACECECAARASAWALLVDWVTAPGTRRRVTDIQRLGSGVWAVELDLGGYRVCSASQRTLVGAIRNALQAAVVA